MREDRRKAIHMAMRSDGVRTWPLIKNWGREDGKEVGAYYTLHCETTKMRTVVNRSAKQKRKTVACSKISYAPFSPSG